jgi:small-conductance mechanosensitive channel
MEQLWLKVGSQISDSLGIPLSYVESSLWSLLLLLFYLVVRRLISLAVSRRIKDVARQYIIRKTLHHVVGIIFLLVLLRLWLGSFGGIGTYLGILSAGLAIALQAPLSNLAGWLFILTRKPFVVGDRIQIGKDAGDVIDIRLFEFSLVEIGNWVDSDQSTGRIIHVPNGITFKEPVFNYTQGFNFVWNEIAVLVTFESNWEAAKEILLQIAREHTAIQSEHAERQVRSAARKYMIHFHFLTPIVWTRVADCGVTLTVRYLCEPRRRRITECTIWEAILRAFAQRDDIDFAYPTQRFYNNAAEGKPGYRSEGGGSNRDLLEDTK